MPATDEPVRSRIVWILKHQEDQRSDPGPVQHERGRIELSAQGRGFRGAWDLG